MDDFNPIQFFNKMQMTPHLQDSLGLKESASISQSYYDGMYFTCIIIYCICSY